ncbi:MAG: regulatory protein RecX [Calditrichaeota bacterium]|nr:regulatory protein RecX [Calditrichota bacterium]
MTFAGRKPPKEPALPYAVKLLAARNYSTRKLRDKLRTRGYDSAEIDEAIQKLQERNLLDDERYAEGFVRTRMETHPRGKNALMRDLISRGVSAATAKHAVTESLSDDQELSMAKDLLQRKSRQYASLDPDTRKRRLTALLARRGFKLDTIRRALSLPDTSENSEEFS